MPVALAASPAVGIVAGGLLGPAVGLLVPAKQAHEVAPIGSSASAERFTFPVVPMSPDDAQPPDAAGDDA